MKAKYSSQAGLFSYPRFAKWACANEPTSVVNPIEHFFINCSKFAVECDWNRKTSENDENFEILVKRKIFGKKFWFFSTKKLKIETLFKNAHWMVFHQNALSVLILRFFDNRVRKIKKNQKKIKKVNVSAGKQRSHFLNLPFYWIGKVQIMPVVAGWLVLD